MMRSRSDAGHSLPVVHPVAGPGAARTAHGAQRWGGGRQLLALRVQRGPELLDECHPVRAGRRPRRGAVAEGELLEVQVEAARTLSATASVTIRSTSLARFFGLLRIPASPRAGKLSVNEGHSGIPACAAASLTAAFPVVETWVPMSACLPVEFGFTVYQNGETSCMRSLFAVIAAIEAFVVQYGSQPLTIGRGSFSWRPPARRASATAPAPPPALVPRPSGGCGGAAGRRCRTRSRTARQVRARVDSWRSYGDGDRAPSGRSGHFNPPRWGAAGGGATCVLGRSWSGP